jgi:hypothetical protein
MVMEGIHAILEKLSSKSVMERKAAIKQLKAHLREGTSHLARLSLLYVSEHDPSYTVRNVARQAFGSLGAQERSGNWERAFAFAD